MPYPCGKRPAGRQNDRLWSDSAASTRVSNIYLFAGTAKIDHRRSKHAALAFNSFNTIELLKWIARLIKSVTRGLCAPVLLPHPTIGRTIALSSYRLSYQKLVRTY